MMHLRILFFIASLLIFSWNFGVQAQTSVSTPSDVAAADVQSSESKVKKGVHPEDGSDLGEVTAESLQQKRIYWMCRNRDVVRTLSIRVGDDGGCLTYYSKEGIASVVSQGQHFASCVHIFANIRRNLEAAGWKCRDISQSRTSSGT